MHFQAEMNTLVSISTLAAFLYSAVATIAPGIMSKSGMVHVYFDSAATIVALILLGRYFEGQAKNARATLSVRFSTFVPKQLSG